MNEQEILQLLGKIGAIITNSHIVYTSGKHGSAYINKDAIYPHTAETSLICRAIAGRFANDNVEVVIAPAIGGVILSQWTAYHLSMMRLNFIYGCEVFGVYAEKERTNIVSPSYGPLPPKHEDRFVIKRGYDKFIVDKRVLVVEDVLTTGNSAKKVIEAAQMIGGKVVGLGVICNRGGVTPSDVADIPKLTALVNINLDAYDEKTCPLCVRGIPINTDVGKGREFIARIR